MRRLYWLGKVRDLNNFLKPSLMKLAVFALFLLIALAYGLSIPKVVQCFIPDCPKAEWVRLPWNFCPICSIEPIEYAKMVVYYSFLPINILQDYSTSQNAPMFAPLLFVQLAYWYVIACLLVWIYHRRPIRFK
jgi:hypothetical protein